MPRLSGIKRLATGQKHDCYGIQKGTVFIILHDAIRKLIGHEEEFVGRVRPVQLVEIALEALQLLSAKIRS
jgi:hypothetical protein